MSYIDLNYHMIFSTKHRRPVIGPEFMPRLREYIGGILRNLGGSMLAANGPADHIHIAARLDQKAATMDVLKEIKGSSSQWIHETVGQSDFAWQDGYAAFTVSHSGVAQVVAYIQRQLEHHRKQNFQEELIEFLRRHEIEYDERYIWS
ncbi:MAG TPA: IS200/IS605 family transposase [Phycisphaerae bacterium]|nr:IS200/IS605 family transposase [Phycisphaerae bacterium]